jgi:hypothetical protein
MIRVGDLLTTGAAAGHAMRVTDPVRARYDRPQGVRPGGPGASLIPVLVTLQ